MSDKKKLYVGRAYHHLYLDKNKVCGRVGLSVPGSAQAVLVTRVN
jgi:hypothetical protein